MADFSIKGNIVDIVQRRIYPANIEVRDYEIYHIEEIEEDLENYILPGFVDAHVHIESSMLIPSEFGRLASVHGTVATISDPHEIANVCGVEGVEFMIENSQQTPFKIFFGAPSCVPATFFETSGAVINAAEVDRLLQNPQIWYLSEMMNYPGVLHQDTEVMAKIEAAKRINKPVDGHAPGLKGEQAKLYALAGIQTDHECFTSEEALDKIHSGMFCLIREGSAAKNFEALIELLGSHPESIMFCSDDKHPDELVLHHINDLVKRALEKGHDLFDVLRAASYNPIQHYKIPVGLLQIGDPADFIVVNNLTDFEVLQTFINGQKVAEDGKSLLEQISVGSINNFKAELISSELLQIKASPSISAIKVIEAIEGQLITSCLITEPKIDDGFIVSDVENDILKIVVLNRYEQTSKPALGFVKNFGLKHGAMASTIAHDCHNIIAVGVDDDSIMTAINALITVKGGIAVVGDHLELSCMPLSIAGLMSPDNGYEVADRYATLDLKAKSLGTSLRAPFMTLSFMALLVIPELKLSDLGLFDGKEFCFTELETKEPMI